MHFKLAVFGILFAIGNIHPMETKLASPSSTIESRDAQEVLHLGELLMRENSDYTQACLYFEKVASQDADLESKRRAFIRLAQICSLTKQQEEMYLYLEKAVIMVHQSEKSHEIQLIGNYLYGLCQDATNMDTEGKYHLLNAAWYNYCELAELILDCGTDVSTKISYFEVPTDLQLQPLIDKLYMKDEVTALHIAALQGHKKSVELLVVKGADVNAKNKNGSTPLYLAASEGHEKTVEQLLFHGADVLAKDIFQWTALHIATRYNHMNVVKLLIENGAEVNAQEETEMTPLCLTFENEDFSVAELLICKGGGIREPWSPLHIAAMMGDTKEVEKLIAQGA